jgi:DNA-binding MarR family transcriptional regulator
MSENDKMKDKLKSLTDIDKLIHEPARLLIISYLYVLESADFIFLRAQTELTWGNLSSHMTKLETAGYVKIEKKFIRKKPHTIASITNEGRKAFENYRRKMKQALE